VSPLLIPIAIEWVILVTTLAPIVLVGRFDSRPKLGLTLWFGSLLSSGLAAAIALAVAFSSIFSTYVKLLEAPFGSSDWQATLVVSFAPWLILAISGVALALINQRLEPLINVARESKPLIDAAAKTWMTFEGHEVCTIEVPIYLAATARGRILISKVAAEELDELDLQAVLWHEVGHIRGRHNALKQLASLVRLLSPWLTASKALVLEVDRLVEIDADRFAVKRVGVKALSETRARFVAF
jgi:Zn-dependent protease with chaperone function